MAVPDIDVETMRGGLNDTDPANALKPDECVQADNIEFFASMCGERRGGSVSLSLTSSGLTAEALICHLSQWFPTNVPTLPEYIGIAATPGTSVSAARRDTAGTWHVLTPSDAIDTAAPGIYGIVTQALDANNFIAYKSANNRLHLITTGSVWRVAGLAAPAAPTAADTGSGSFTGTRYYRVRYTEVSGSTVVRRSEPGPVLTFVPSKTGAAARVTKPAAISEGETNWELEASLDNANWYRIASTVVGTTTYDDHASSAKTYPTVSHAAPTSNDGTAITYVLLSDQAAALNLTGTVSNGIYGNPAGTIAGRGWIGYTSGGVYIPAFPPTWSAGQNWYASPDVAVAMEQASVGGDGQDYAATGTLSEAVGAYLTIPSAKFLAVDGDRLIWGGHQTDPALASTVGWTPKKGDPGVGNSERNPIVTTGGEDIVSTRDLDNYDGGPLTGLAASTLGTWYAFKWQRIYSAVENQNVTNAYDVNCVSSTRGAIPGSVVKAANPDGSSTIFFLDPNVGLCRLGVGGVINTIRGVRTTWGTVNVKATSLVCCGCFYPYKHQVRWWVATAGSNVPNLGITLQTSELQQRGESGELGRGISLVTARQSQALCAAALTVTVNNQTTEVPFIGQTSPEFVQRLDTGVTDNGTTYVATLKSRPLFLAGMLNKFGIIAGALLATANAAGSIILSLVRDEGGAGQTNVSTVATSLAPVASEPQVIKIFDGLAMRELRSLNFILTDGGANTPWACQMVSLKPSLEQKK
jgi:hypothetical protein